MGSIVEGNIKNTTDFAIFLSVKNFDIDGMIHYKDLSWSEEESELQKYSKNSSIKAKVLEIDQDKEKLRLGIKQLEKDPFDFFKDKKKSDIITVTVKEVQENGIRISVENHNLIYTIKKNQIAVAKEDARPSRFTKGDKIDVMIVELDISKRKVSLSIKALEEAQSREAVKKYGSKDSGASLGEILGPVLKKKNK